MARDIFQRQVELGTPLAADATRLLLPDLGDGDLMVQSVSVQYQQNINRLWEVGSFKTFFIAGRTQGTLQLKRVIGAKGLSTGFIQRYGDVCQIRSNQMTLSLGASCTDFQNQGGLKVEGCVITSVGYSIAAADMIINEDIAMMFAKLGLS